jgi:acyl-coenzyme A synthetase/AMP-(fatty) acid ligase
MSAATILGWLDDHARLRGARPAVTSNGRSVDFLTLQKLVRSAAAALQQMPTDAPEGRVILAVADPLQQWVLVLAAMSCGLTPCPMVLHEPRIAGLARAPVICDKVQYVAFMNAFAARRCFVAPALDGSGSQLTVDVLLPQDDRATAVVLLSSGTTGLPKPVPLSFVANLNRAAMREHYFPSEGDVVLLMQPGFAGGLQSCIKALQIGVRIDISDRLDAIIPGRGCSCLWLYHRARRANAHDRAGGWQ